MDENSLKKFLKTINPQISEEEFQFCFSKLDKKGTGKVSINTLTEKMKEYNISMNSSNKGLPIVSSNYKKEKETEENFDVVDENIDK